MRLEAETYRSVKDGDVANASKWGNCPSIHPASRGVAAHTAGLFRSVRGAKGGVEYEEQSSTGFPS